MELDELLGINTKDPVEMLARDLVREHRELLNALVSMRRERYTQQEVADRLNIPVQAVVDFERYDSDPRLSPLRRYAMAVRATVRHAVTQAVMEKNEDYASFVGRTTASRDALAHEHSLNRQSHVQLRRLLKS